MARNAGSVDVEEDVLYIYSKDTWTDDKALRELQEVGMSPLEELFCPPGYFFAGGGLSALNYQLVLREVADLSMTVFLTSWCEEYRPHLMVSLLWKKCIAQHIPMIS
ncbi:hypothetical protein MKX03_026188 [Papaver bracteatum]|nr:hypothetical protein MKX03_026188 [Papaver bracteatum]